MKSEQLKELINMFETRIQPVFEKMFKIEMDYTKESLCEIEKQINEYYPEGHKPIAPTTLVPYGVYLGETIINNVPGAEWHHENDEPIFDAYIKIRNEKEGEGQVAYPFRRIEKFWEDRTDSIVAFFKLIEMMDSGEVQEIIENTPDGEWIELPGGVRFRKTTMDKEEYEKSYK